MAAEQTGSGQRTYALRCAACGASFEASRPHARTCSHRCRTRLYRDGLEGFASVTERRAEARFRAHERLEQPVSYLLAQHCGGHRHRGSVAA